MPFKATLPRSGTWKPVSTLINVVFPAPLGPIRPRISPGRKVRWMSSMARRPWKLTTTPATSSADAVATFTSPLMALSIPVFSRAQLFRHLRGFDHLDDVARLAVLHLDQQQVALHVDMLLVREGGGACQQLLILEGLQRVADLVGVEGPRLLHRLAPGFDHAIAGDRMRGDRRLAELGLVLVHESLDFRARVGAEHRAIGDEIHLAQIRN